MASLCFRNGGIVLKDRLLEDGWVLVEHDRIAAVGRGTCPERAAEVIDLAGGYLCPGFIDLHVHGGDGADFMDGTREAFATVCRAHLRHGTTSLLPTGTVAGHEQLLAFLELCTALKGRPETGARILGAHFYGPYFAREARGCHPEAPVRPPCPEEYERYLEFAAGICRATVAVELPGAEAFVRACRRRGIACNVGHSFATFDQVRDAIAWGVSHVDHLFCAMSDRARLRQMQTYPMRGGVMEATLFFDDLTTEVIADGKHLQSELLALALKIKGPDRLALVTDCNRALDCPDGEYVFGPKEGGEKIFRRDGVGIMPDGRSLASGVFALDHGVRTFHKLTQTPLPIVVRMASLTPAKIAGVDRDYGSIETGKVADLVVMDTSLKVQRVYRDGQVAWRRETDGNG